MKAENQHISLKLSLSYLFSYAWLIGELILFTVLLSLLPTTTILWLSPLFFICFARLYYWLNFSPETGVQTLFILGIIPLNTGNQFLQHTINYWEVLGLFLGLFLLLGIIRNRFTVYTVNATTVEYKFIATRSYTRDLSQETSFLQHSRGKRLDFGCILVPIETRTLKKKSFLKNLFFSQRQSTRFTNHLRVDGIANPNMVVKEINTTFNK